MKRKIKKRKKFKYEDDFDGLNIDDYVTLKDPILPSPEQLALELINSRITILLDEGIVSFFKKHAEKHGVGYQQLIRQVLRNYVNQAKRAA